MKSRPVITVDGNEAAARIAYKTNEVIGIYPITPASPMGEWSDMWSSLGQKNVWGTVPRVIEMQSEGGAAGAVHGALQGGALTTTFTASQGLLLMIPNLYKIAGELTSAVFHVAARSVAAQALSIFGDHSDVMAARATGFAMLFSNSVQEAMDMALIAQAATLEARLPFLHVFDGFRTSHEIQKIECLEDEDIRALIDDGLVQEHRARALSPDHPFIRGTAQNPDIFFQARESVNAYYEAAPEITQRKMDALLERVGRSYRLFDYVGAEDAERVIVMMGSGSEAAEETVQYLLGKKERVGLLKVRLYRPFSVKHFLAQLPSTLKVIAALDRTKEPGATGEPLYHDVLAAVSEGRAGGSAPFSEFPRVTGGRYGLSSKEFTPAMVKGIYGEMARPEPRNHFTVGIIDDVTHTSIDFERDFDLESVSDKTTKAVFWGLGSDGTVGANKNTIKIIASKTPAFAQGYFVYDSKKSGARTVSHLRFGPEPIKRSYLIKQADFLAVHQFSFLERFEPLAQAGTGATLLLNSPYDEKTVWEKLPREAQEAIIEKQLDFYVIDAYSIAREMHLGMRINTIMQTCFFALMDILPVEEAIEEIKNTIRKTYGKRGEVVVQNNLEAVDRVLSRLHPVRVPEKPSGNIAMPPLVPSDAPDFVRRVTAEMMAGRGDLIPVGALPADGTFPSHTSRFEKRNIAAEIPVWAPDLCIQCGKCVMVCPHSVIRSKIFEASALAEAPASFPRAEARWRNGTGKKYTLMVSAEDCTGCTLCVEICPAKDKSRVGRKAINMAPQRPLLEEAKAHWDYFLKIPEMERKERDGGMDLKFNSVKNVQLLPPLFEFSGACAGCGETPYLKLLSQLFGDRALIANATGCSSIYGGNLPTTPWATDRDGRGPAWSNSLFEDNAEFGLGMRLALDKQGEFARELVKTLRGEIGDGLAGELLEADQSTEAGIAAQRARVEELIKGLEGKADPASRNLRSLARALVRKSVWIVGGDGWAYDIGFGGLDHVLANLYNVNILILDTEVYSNTGGQASKATPLGAVAKFAAGGKTSPKKNLGLLAMNYGHVYVAEVAMGANDTHTIRAFLEAEAFHGPSLIIAYCHCIAHGIDMSKGMRQQKLAVQSGHWPLFRYHPDLKREGKNPFQLDSKEAVIPLKDYHYNENRFRILVHSNPQAAKELLEKAQETAKERFDRYLKLAESD